MASASYLFFQILSANSGKSMKGFRGVVIIVGGCFSFFQQHQHSPFRNPFNHFAIDGRDSPDLRVLFSLLVLGCQVILLDKQEEHQQADQDF